MEVKARITPDNRFIQITEAPDIELEQIRHSFNKRITNWRFHPLVKKKFGMVTYPLSTNTNEYL
jgi:hypothetical protein